MLENLKDWNKILIVCWDGATFDIINPMLKAGKMPTLSKLMENGSYGRLQSTIPPITAPAWGTLLTGMNPGKHGVFWFKELQRDENSFAVFSQPIDSSRLSGKTLLDFLSAEDYKIISHLVQMTYPAWPINGVMVSGWQLYGHERCEKRHYPPEVASILSGKDFISSDGRKESKIWVNLKANRDVALQLLEHNIQKCLGNALKLMGRYEWDVFITYFTDPDCVQHTYWDFMNWDSIANDYSEGDFGTAIYRIYQVLDDALSKILEHVSDDTIVFIISDHGAQRAPHKYLFINQFLKDRGLLKMKPQGFVTSFIWRVFNNSYFPVSKGHTILNLLTEHLVDWKQSKAYGISFSWLTGGVYLKRGNFTNRVGSAAYDKTREDLINNLHELRDPITEEKVIEAIWKCEELWNGPYLDNAPDIVFNLKAQYGLNFFPSGRLVDLIRRKIRGGGHSMEGIFVASAKAKDSAIKPSNEISFIGLADIMPTILYYLGIPIPSYVDGKVITDMFKKDFLHSKPIRFREVTRDKGISTKRTFSEEEVKKLEERLRGLGYLD